MKRSWAYLALLASLPLSACVAPGRPPLLNRQIGSGPRTAMLDRAVAPTTASDPSAPRERLIRKARKFAGGAPLKAGAYSFEADPVGFVRAAYWSVGIDLFDAGVADDEALDGLTILYRSAAERDQLHRDSPKQGDLLFLGETEGKDPLPLQVAVVESVDPDGTVTAIGNFAGGPRRLLMTPGQRSRLQARDGATVNTPVTSKGRPAAQLFLSYADPFS